MVDGTLSALAPNVVFLRAGAPTVYGRNGVRELLSAGAQAEGTTVTWEPLGGGVSYDLMSAYTYGVAARSGTPRSAIRLERYIAVWQRQRGAAWQIIAYAEVGAPAANEVAFSTNVVTPPLVAPPLALRESLGQVRAADSLFADLSDRMGLGFASSSTSACGSAGKRRSTRSRTGFHTNLAAITHQSRVNDLVRSSVELVMSRPMKLKAALKWTS
jgi:hypothetical protein